MNKNNIKLAPVIIAVSILILIVLIGTISSYETQKGRPLAMLSVHRQGITDEFNAGFVRWMSEVHGEDVHVEVYDIGGGGSAMERYIRKQFENKPQSIGVDILFGGGPTMHTLLATDDYLEVFAPSTETSKGLQPTVAGIEINDPALRWHGAALSSFGIIANELVVEKLGLPSVKTWERLAHPLLYGLVACGNPASSGAVKTCFEIILQAHGFNEGHSILVRLAGNVAAFDEGGNSAARGVGLAQAAYGLSIDIYAYEQISRYGADSINYTIPEGQSVISPDPIAILRGAPDMELAKKYMEFVLSEDGQMLWYASQGTSHGPVKHSLNRMSVRESVYYSGEKTSVSVNPFDAQNSLKYDGKLASRRSPILADLIVATMIDVHTDLKAAWRAIIDAGDIEHPELVKQFCASPVTGEELLRLAKIWRKDKTLKQQKIYEWTDFARNKFRRVREDAEMIINMRVGGTK